MKVEFITFGIIAVALIILSLSLNIGMDADRNTNADVNKTINLPNLGKAPELAGIKGWINSEPLTIASLQGKVVMVDFWTYSCINCIRTIPYLNDWHAKYADKGLVIIGVHTPEFEFEKDYNNVKAAVEKYGIKHAVAQDNDYATWRAYNNRFWPRKYIVDKEGNIRYDHIGEGAYEETEKVIQDLLDVKMTTTSAPNKTTSQVGTPELYLGYNFARAPLGNPEGFSPENIVEYKPIEITKPNIIYLSGAWQNKADYMTAVKDAKLFLVYRAKDLNIVAGSSQKLKINIMLDNIQIPSNALGKDVILENGKTTASINESRLYNIISAPDYQTHLIEISAEPGFQLYTFTFG